MTRQVGRACPLSADFLADIPRERKPLAYAHSEPPASPSGWKRVYVMRDGHRDRTHPAGTPAGTHAPQPQTGLYLLALRPSAAAERLLSPQGQRALSWRVGFSVFSENRRYSSAAAPVKNNRVGPSAVWSGFCWGDPTRAEYVRAGLCAGDGWRCAFNSLRPDAALTHSICGSLMKTVNVGAGVVRPRFFSPARKRRASAGVKLFDVSQEFCGGIRGCGWRGFQRRRRSCCRFGRRLFLRFFEGGARLSGGHFADVGGELRGRQRRGPSQQKRG
jgi:hypothetical protein